jgi:Mg/Co/Ni transporter MgtE
MEKEIHPPGRERAALGLARLRADTALASGPVATVVQDILSVAIYLSIATMVLHW